MALGSAFHATCKTIQQSWLGVLYAVLYCSTYPDLFNYLFKSTQYSVTAVKEKTEYKEPSH